MNSVSAVRFLCVCLVTQTNRKLTIWRDFAKQQLNECAVFSARILAWAPAEYLHELNRTFLSPAQSIVGSAAGNAKTLLSDEVCA